MAEYFFPFDSGAGTTVTSEQWSQMASMWQTDGIRAPRTSDPADPLAAASSGQDMTVTISPGHATVQGFHYHSDVDRNVVIAPNVGTQPRVDRITVRLTRTGQRISIAYLQGTPAAQPQPPALSQGQDGLFDVPLCRVAVAPQAGAVAPRDITDERVYALTPRVYANTVARTSSVERPVPGALAYLQGEGRMEIYGAGAWTPLSPGPWQPLPLPSDVVAHGGNPRFRLVNGTIELSGSVERKDGKDFNVAPSWRLAVLPPEARPRYLRSFVCATSLNFDKGSSARVDVISRSDQTAGGEIQADIQSPVKWIYLDAIRFALDA
ncbi:hypothetical protein AB0H73_01350 [Streptomyces olivoreticuli]